MPMKPAIKAPPLELSKPLTPKERMRIENEEAARRASVGADAARAETVAKGPGKGAGVFSRLREVLKGPDKSFEGLSRAAHEAIAETKSIKWVSASDMCEELEHLVMHKLNVQHGVTIAFVGCHSEDMTARLLIRTDWHWRLAIKGTTSFGAWPAPARN